MRVLVVEDHPKLADYLRKGLTENGYVVDVAADGIDGRHLAVNGEYDIVVLDVMLPGLDGFAVLKAIRAAKDVAVLMLTARDQVEDRVRGQSYRLVAGDLQQTRVTGELSFSSAPWCQRSAARTWPARWRCW